MTEPRSHSPQLIVHLGERRFRIRLEPGVTSIGSSPDCSLCLEGEDVAPRHCIIQPAHEGGFEIFDLMSSAGTLLNNKQVEAATLQHGDQIKLGGLSITFLVPQIDVASASAPTMETDAPAADTDTIPLVEDGWESLRGSPEFRMRLDRDDGAQNPVGDVESHAPCKSWTDRWDAFRERRVARAFERDAERSRRKEEKRLHRARHGQVAATAPAIAAPSTDYQPPNNWEESATRYSESTFRDVLVYQLKTTPYLVFSLAVHVILAIVLSLIISPGRVRKEPPPTLTGLTNPAASLPEEIEDFDAVEPPPEEIEITEISEPEVTDDLPEFELPETMEPLEDSGLDNERTPAFHEGITGLNSGGLLGGGDPGLNVGTKGFRKYVRSLRRRGLEVVVVIDSTGSMGPVIEQAREQVSRIISTLGALVPGFRLGVVTYRDRNEAYMVRSEPLTQHWYKAVAFLDTITAAGGGDTPEAVLEGLENALDSAGWIKGSKRVVILVGDAPNHRNDEPRLKSLLQKFAKKDGMLHAVATGNHSKKISEITEQAFRQMAAWGGGVYMPLDDSGALSQKIIQVAFGSSHRTDMLAAMERLESGVRKEREARLAAKGTPSQLLTAFRANEPNQILFRELQRLPRKPQAWVYLDVLEDKSIPLSSRWAATLLLRRLVGRFNPGDAAVNLVHRIDPDMRAGPLAHRTDLARKAFRNARWPRS